MNQALMYKNVAKNYCNNDLVLQHAQLVKRIAYHMLSKLPESVQIGDLIQSGMLGLIEATKTYRSEKNPNFEAFASIRIRGAMLDDLRKGDWVPRSVYQNARRITSAIQEIEKIKHHPAQPHEIANFLNISLDEYNQMLADSSACDLFCFDSTDNNTEHNDDENENPFETISKDNLKAIVSQEIALLPEREQLILSLHINEELNLKEIGHILDISESRVCQLHSQALRRLKARIAAKVKE